MKKRIVVDINHPAHIHFFKNCIWQLKAKEHEVFITASSKDVVCALLDTYAFKYINLGSYGNNIVQKVINVPIMDFKMYQAVKAFRPDIFIGLASFRSAHVAFLLRKDCIIFDDTEHWEEILLYLPFVKNVFTPSCFKKNLGKKHIRYNGYHELAYLHPNYFKPNPQVLQEIGLLENERFFVVRFVSWNAGHDIGKHGFSREGKNKLIHGLKRFGKVIISSEGELPEELKPYKMAISETRMHDLLSYATIYVGEGATMASEAAILGTPAIYVSNIEAGTLEEQEKKYGLLFSFNDEDKAIAKVFGLLEVNNLKQRWQEKREAMLNEKIDVTALVINAVEKMNPDGMAKE